MGLEFLQSYGGSRVRSEVAVPLPVNDDEEAESNERVDHNYELPAEQWRPRPIAPATALVGWPLRPRRYVDGKDVGRTVAWLRSPREGYPVPVRLSEIGAVVIQESRRELHRVYQQVERVVSLMTDLFPWDEVESFALALRANDFRLLLCAAPRSSATYQGGYSYDFERMRKTTENRSLDEMTRLESQALALAKRVPTVVDGRLEPRRAAFEPARDPVAGVVKTHRQMYLHAAGWQSYYDLAPSERTPAFLLHGHNLAVVSWYLRLAGQRQEMPNTGIVRVEIPQLYFESVLGKDMTHLDRLSRAIYDCRCQDDGYGRAAISIYPIQRAEEKLGALFTETNTLVSRFYRLTNL